MTCKVDGNKIICSHDDKNIVRNIASEMRCEHCDGCGIVNNKLCKECNGHGVVLYEHNIVQKYSRTLEQSAAADKLGGLA